MNDEPRASPAGAVPAGGAAPAGSARVMKHRLGGSHRLVPPTETLARVRPLLPAFGITRIANVTGLDHIGIPVVVVCRPNSRSLSVSQGKGLDLAAAQASGVMESIECWHAERIRRPLLLASWNELRHSRPLPDMGALPRLSVSRYHAALRLLWIEGQDIARGGACWLPFELVHLDMTLPLPEGSGCFPLGSNGLASGNHPVEALVHGLSEVIERDAFALWSLAGGSAQAATRVDLDTVTDAGCRALLDRFTAAGMLVGAWDMTSDIRVPAFYATILDREPDPFRPLYPSPGMGCHPAREVALFRALAEAAQSRLTRISSSRDDVPRSDYELTRNPDLLARVHERLSAQPRPRAMEDAPTGAAADLDGDLEFLLSRLRAAGVHSVIAVDLSLPGLGIDVVRVVVPGLEPKPGGPGWAPGARAQAVLAARDGRADPDARGDRTHAAPPAIGVAADILPGLA